MFGKPLSRVAEHLEHAIDNEMVTVYFDVPGVAPDDLDITVEKNSVSVEASRRWFDPEVRTLSSERSRGSFKREFQLGDHLDPDALKAKMAHGVLTLTIPIKEGTKPRSIEVGTADASEQELSTSSS